MGRLATSPLLFGGGGGGHASKQGIKSAHKWADGLHHPYRLGGPKCCTTGNKISTG